MDDRKTTIQQVKDLVLKFQRERNWNPDKRALAVSIVIEASELLEHFQWDDWESGHNKREVEKELADVIIYILEFADKNDIDIAQAVAKKISYNEKKYPLSIFKNQRENSKAYYQIKRKYRKA